LLTTQLFHHLTHFPYHPPDVPFDTLTPDDQHKTQKRDRRSGRKEVRKGFVSGRDQKDPKRMGRVLLATMITPPPLPPPPHADPHRK